MANIDRETIKEINDNVDVVDYARQNMTLERRSRNYFAHCPKHRDDTPSLCFSERENRYYCFSCHCGGKIIDYLIDFEGMKFRDAVEKASKLAGVDLSTLCRSNTISYLKDVKSVIRKRNDKKNSKKFVHPTLPKSRYDQYEKCEVKEWIDEGIEKDVLDLFEVRYDKMNHRIVYPVYDADGNLINIKGRTTLFDYKEMKIPKYINYYPIGCMDYFQCLNVTMPYIKEKNEVIIFESIKSVMKAYGWGYKNCVSAEKHNLTPEQIMLLVKMRVNVVLAYDSDVSYYKNDVAANINILKRTTNVFTVGEINGVLGGADAKNAPVDCGRETWEFLYNNRRKVK